jgi:hypothetical protein
VDYDFLGDDDTIGDNCVEVFFIEIAEVEQQKKINVIRYATVVIDQMIPSIYCIPK